TAIRIGADEIAVVDRIVTKARNDGSQSIVSRIIVVGVQQMYPASPSEPNALVHRVVDTLVRFGYPANCVAGRPQQLKGLIGRSSVDNNMFEVTEGLLPHTAQGVRKRRFTIIRDRNHRNQW